MQEVIDLLIYPDVIVLNAIHMIWQTLMENFKPGMYV